MSKQLLLLFLIPCEADNADTGLFITVTQAGGHSGNVFVFVVVVGGVNESPLKWWSAQYQLIWTQELNELFLI